MNDKNYIITAELGGGGGRCLSAGTGRRSTAGISRIIVDSNRANSCGGNVVEPIGRCAGLVIACDPSCGIEDPIWLLMINKE